MTDENSRRAWETIISHRQPTSDYNEIDAYLDSPLADHNDLVDGWRSLLSPSSIKRTLSPESEGSSVGGAASFDCSTHVNNGLDEECSTQSQTVHNCLHTDMLLDSDETEDCRPVVCGAEANSLASKPIDHRSCDYSTAQRNHNEDFNSSADIGNNSSQSYQEIIEGFLLLESVNKQLAEDADIHPLYEADTPSSQSTTVGAMKALEPSNSSLPPSLSSSLSVDSVTREIVSLSEPGVDLVQCEGNVFDRL